MAASAVLLVLLAGVFGTTPASQSPSTQVLDVQKSGRIARVRLNRPDALNAANDELHHRLAEVWGELAGDPGEGGHHVGRTT